MGKPNFETLTFTINHSRFLYGDLINNAIAFISVAVAIYFIVVAPMNAAQTRRRGAGEPEPEVSEEIGLLTEIRDLLARPSDWTPPL